MNKVILIGRLVRDPEIRVSQGAQPITIANYTLAVDRRFRKNDQDQEPEADFIRCIAFGRSAEHAEKYYRKGLKVVVTGHIQTGSYTNRDGQKVYTTDVIVEEQEFAESKASADNRAAATGTPTSTSRPASPSNAANGYMNIPDGIDEELPFN